MRSWYFRLGLIFLVTASFSGVVAAASETITISTYYPAPFGVYKQMKVMPTQTAYMVLGDDPNNSRNPVISLVDADATAAAGAGTLRPSITFQNSVSTAAVDFRIAQFGDNDLRIIGGTTTFVNNGGNYGRIRAGELWICSGLATPTNIVPD
ncbi:MAG: hypothetical protein ABH865_03205 [Candidatus Omnitrophota bacterium]